MIQSSGHQAPPEWVGGGRGYYILYTIYYILYIIYYILYTIYTIYIYTIYIYTIYTLLIYYIYTIVYTIYIYTIYHFPMDITPPSHRGGRGKHLFSWTSQPIPIGGGRGGPGRTASYMELHYNVCLGTPWHPLVDVQDREARIASLEEESKEAKAQVKVLETQLQQAVASHTDRAAELQLRSWLQRVDGRLVMVTMMGEDGVRRD